MDRYRDATVLGNFITPRYSVEKVDHMQGIVQYDGCIFFVFTHLLAKINSNLQVENTFYNSYHLGSPTMHNGFLYLPVEKGGFNGKRPSNSFVYKIDPDDLSIIDEVKVEETVYGLGGIAFGDNKFILIGGNLSDSQINYIYEYDTNLIFTQTHIIYSGKTDFGFQTITYNKDLLCWELSGYNSHENNNSQYSSFVLDRNLQLLGSLHGIDLEPSNFGLSHDVENLHYIGMNYYENNVVYAIVFKNQPQILKQYSLYRIKNLNDDKPTYFTKDQIIKLNEQINDQFSIRVDIKLKLDTEHKTNHDYFLLGGHDNTYSRDSLQAAFTFLTIGQGRGQFKFMLKNEANSQAVLFSDDEITIEQDKVYRLMANYNGSLIKFFIDDILQDQINMNGSIQDFSEFTVGPVPTASEELQSELYNINIMNDVLIK